MARPRCDPFDAPAMRAAIDGGETTERAAYLTYAATAARPYARSTFALILRREPEPERGAAKDDGDTLDRWGERAPIKPRILSLSAGGGLRVKAGCLIAFDGPLTLTYSKASKPPLAIVLSAAGGFVSIEAIRFCARAGVALIALDRAHGFLSLMSGAPKASAATLRMQVRADPVPIARTIVAAIRQGARPRSNPRSNPQYRSAGFARRMAERASASVGSWAGSGRLARPVADAHAS
jgi:hypothetical protein